MTAFGGPVSSGLAGVTGAQEVHGQARAKREREKAETARRFEDALELRVAGIESSDAVRPVTEHEDGKEDQQRGNSSGAEGRADEHQAQQAQSDSVEVHEEEASVNDEPTPLPSSPQPLPGSQLDVTG